MILVTEEKKCYPCHLVQKKKSNSPLLLSQGFCGMTPCAEVPRMQY